MPAVAWFKGTCMSMTMSLTYSRGGSPGAPIDAEVRHLGMIINEHVCIITISITLYNHTLYDIIIIICMCIYIHIYIYAYNIIIMYIYIYNVV